MTSRRRIRRVSLPRSPFLVSVVALAVVACTGAPGEPILARPTAARPSRAPATAPPMAVADPTPVVLPRDDGPHDRLTEWWYYTGHLRDAAGGRFGFEYVIFRAERGRFPTSWVSHLAVTDETGGRFLYSQRLEVGAGVDRSPRDADGLPTGFDLALSGADPASPATAGRPAWRMAGGGGTDRLTASLAPDEAAAAGVPAGLGLDLRLAATKPAALHDRDGWIDFGPAGGSYYYSRTAMTAAGRLSLDGQTRDVDGIAWFDHQWGDFISVGGGGWDWFAVNLDDGTDLSLSLVRDADGSTPLVYGTLVAADGSVRHLERDAFSVEVVDHWTSPATGAAYPAGWTIRIPGERLAISLRPTVAAQELDTRPTTGVVYWEGSQVVRATRDGRAIGGDGYVELTGYAPARIAGAGAGSALGLRDRDRRQLDALGRGQLARRRVDGAEVLDDDEHGHRRLAVRRGVGQRGPQPGLGRLGHRSVERVEHDLDLVAPRPMGSAGWSGRSRAPRRRPATGARGRSRSVETPFFLSIAARLAASTLIRPLTTVVPLRAEIAVDGTVTTTGVGLGVGVLDGVADGLATGTIAAGGPGSDRVTAETVVTTPIGIPRTIPRIRIARARRRVTPMTRCTPQPVQRHVPLDSGRAQAGQLKTRASVSPIASPLSSGGRGPLDLPRSTLVAIWFASSNNPGRGRGRTCRIGPLPVRSSLVWMGRGRTRPDGPVGSAVLSARRPDGRDTRVVRLSLTRQGDYAVRAMLALAAHPDDDWLSVPRISASMDIPERVLPRVMTDLARADLVEGRPGRTGGYRLARPADAITLLDVISAVEPEPDPRTCILRGVSCGIDGGVRRP